MTDKKSTRNLILKAISDLQSALESLTDGEPTLPPDAQKRLDQGICLKCGKPLNEGKGKPSRGCHHTCYQTIMRTIASSGESENDAVAKGLLAPASNAGRKPQAKKLDDFKQPRHKRI